MFEESLYVHGGLQAVGPYQSVAAFGLRLRVECSHLVNLQLEAGEGTEERQFHPPDVRGAGHVLFHLAAHDGREPLGGEHQPQCYAKHHEHQPDQRAERDAENLDGAFRQAFASVGDNQISLNG